MGQAKSCYPRDNSLGPCSIFDDASVSLSSSFRGQIGDISDNSANIWWRQGGIGFSGNTRHNINLEGSRKENHYIIVW